MRSDRDKRTDTEREIDEFLSKFESPADELSADINSYLDENDPAETDVQKTVKVAAAQTFTWKNIEPSELAELQDGNKTDTSVPSGKENGIDANEDIPSENIHSGSSEKPEEPDINSEDGVIENPVIVEEKTQEVIKDAEIQNDKVNTKIKENTDTAESKEKKGVNAKEKKSKKKSKNKRPLKKGDIVRILFLKKNKDYDPSQGAVYKKDGKTIKNKKYKFSFLKLLRNIGDIGILCMMAALIVVLSIIATAPKYDYKDIYSQIDTASVVYDDQGKQVDNIFYTENRKVINYEDMPADLINSFVAIEDKTFWKHHGFNWTRMIGAVLSSLTGSGRISGTSTITQQLARNVYLADTKSVRSIRRKLLEMYYASRLEHSLSKEQIIEAYLNTIYLGHGCYGVNAAARTYFSKKVKDLDLVECASLAALPQSPDTYALLKLAGEAQEVVDSKVVATEPDTVVTNDISRSRRQLTLDLMLSQNLIDKEAYDSVYNLTLNEFINPNLKSSSNIYSFFHEYLVDTIIADLMEQYGMEYEDAERTVYTKGLQIYSTVDSTAMEVIAKEFQDGSNFPYVSAPLDSAGNMLNNDGQIALYKYANYFDDDGNFILSGAEGDVAVGSDGSITIMANHKLHIYETEVDGATDYSLEFRNYYFYDDDDIMYSIAGGYLNIPSAYKSSDGNGNVIIDKSFFEDEYYQGALVINGEDVIVTQKAYTLSPRQRQPQAAMTIVGVGTGEVKAMVGGRQFGGQKVLNRSLNPRQPGSSIKPLAVYGAALQKSYDLAAEGKKWTFTDFHIDKQGTKGWGDYVTMHSSIEDEKTKIEGKYWPNNFNNSFSGKNTFKTAIQKSINTCAVKLVLQVGNDYSIEQLKKFGLTTVQDDLSNPVNDANPAALGLGAMTQGVEPLEMALAYASFPGGGKLNTPICYTKVLDRNGEVLLEGKSEQSEALNEGVAWIMQEVLKSVVSYNKYMSVSDVEPGGKTGTTNDQYDIWFDGFTPTYAASIWIGTDENVEMSSMSTPAAALWGKIINQLPNAKAGAYAPMPANVVEKSGEYFTKGTETGLTSWSSKEQRKKERKEAYNKWLQERELHKKKVVDVAEHDEIVYREETYLIRDAWTEYVTVHHDAEYSEVVVDDFDEHGKKIGQHVERKLIRDSYDESMPVNHPAEYGTRKVEAGTVHVPEVWHYEYEKGWRDGDFKFKG